MSSEPDATELETRLRAVERKLRRDKLGLEKLNPLVHGDAYVAALEHVADLEAERRDLKRALRAATVGASTDDEPGAEYDADDDASDTDEDDESDDSSSDDDLSDGAGSVGLRDEG